MTDNNHSLDTPQRSYNGLRIVAVALLAVGLLVLYQTFQIAQGGGYSAVGPRFFPLMVAVSLIVLSVIFLLRATVRPDHVLAEQAAAEESATHWPTVGLTTVALVVYAFALGMLGYIVATALFFLAVARVLGSRHPARDLLVGIVLGVTIYVVFTRFLGVRLPGGVLDGLL
jgi:putative tricarboxylic transport membrane protein